MVQGALRGKGVREHWGPQRPSGEQIRGVGGGRTTQSGAQEGEGSIKDELFQRHQFAGHASCLLSVFWEEAATCFGNAFYVMVLLMDKGCPLETCRSQCCHHWANA